MLRDIADVIWSWRLLDFREKRTSSARRGRRPNGIVGTPSSFSLWCAALGAVLGLYAMPAQSARFLHEPGVMEASYDEGRRGVELSLTNDFISDALRAELGKAVATQGQFTNLRVMLTAVADASDSLTIKGEFKVDFKEKIIGQTVTVSCDVLLRIRIEDQPLTESSLSLNRKDPVFTKCDVSGDIAKKLELGRIVKEALNEIVNFIPQGFLQAAIGEKIFSNPEALDRFCRMLLLHGLIEKIRIGTANCVLDGKAAFCVRIYWPPAAHDALLANAFKAIPSPKGPAPGVAPALVSSWRSFAPIAPQNPQDPCGSPADLDGPLLNGIPAKQDCDSGDMALFGGLLCASGEKSACRMVEGSQGVDGRFWRSPRLKNVAGQHNEFSGDMFLGIIHWAISELNNPRLAAWQGYIATHTVRVPDGATLHVPYGRSCVNDSNGTCNVSADNWKLLNLVSAVVGVPPTGHPSFDSAYRSDAPATLPLYAAVNELGFRLHLIAVQVWAYQRLGIKSAELDLAAKILAARQPTNPFYLYLHLGADKVVQDALEAQCPAMGVVPSERREWAWERDSYERASDRSMGWDCIFMANLIQSKINLSSAPALPTGGCQAVVSPVPAANRSAQFFATSKSWIISFYPMGADPQAGGWVLNSIDRGANWQLCPSPGQIVSVRDNGSREITATTAGYGPVGLLSSNDNGASWAPMEVPFAHSPIRQTPSAPTYLGKALVTAAASNDVCCQIGGGRQLSGLFAYNDALGLWELLGNGKISSLRSYSDTDSLVFANFSISAPYEAFLVGNEGKKWTKLAIGNERALASHISASGAGTMVLANMTNPQTYRLVQFNSSGGFTSSRPINEKAALAASVRQAANGDVLLHLYGDGFLRVYKPGIPTSLNVVFPIDTAQIGLFLIDLISDQNWEILGVPKKNGSPYVYSTVDGGKTWNQTAVPLAFP